MKIYSITKAARSELHDWLAAPLPEKETREPFLIQVFFGGKLSDEELLNLLQHEKKTAQESLLAYDPVHQAATAQPNSVNDPRAVFLSMLTLEYGIKSNRALL